MTEHPRCQNALEFGRPDALLLPGEGRVNPTDKWFVDWPIRCQCGGEWLQYIDFAGNEDRVDSLFWAKCTSCQSRFPLFGQTQGMETPEEEAYDEELVELVPCAECKQPGVWRCVATFLYRDDVQDDADEDFPEFYDEGLANQWDSFELRCECRCGHQATLMDWEAW